MGMAISRHERKAQMRRLYQNLNNLRTQDLLIQKMRFRKQTRMYSNLKNVLYGASALIGGHLFKILSEGLALGGFDVLAVILLIWSATAIAILELNISSDLAGHELIQDLLEMRSGRQGLTSTKRFGQIRKGS